MPALVDEVRERIRRRYCRPEDANSRVPTERDLVTELAVSRSTIRKAMRELEISGLVKRYQGRGTFVTGPDRHPDNTPISHPSSPTPPLTTTHPTIAIVGRGTLSRQSNAAWLTAALDQVYHRGMFAITTLSHGDPVREFEMVQQALDRPVDGILVQPCIDEYYSGRLRQRMGELGVDRGIPIVTLGQSASYRHARSVWFDEFTAGYLAGRHLVELGHRHIAVIKSSQSEQLRNRIHGFLSALEEAGIEVADQDIIDVVELPRSPTIKLGRTAATLLLSRPTPPTAVFAYWIELAAGVMMEALERGLRIPDDLALAGVGIHLFTETRQQLPVDITTVTYDEPKLAEYAIDLLQAMLTDADPGPNPAAQPILKPAGSTVPIAELTEG